MRVLQLIDSLDAGGAERMAVNIANSLASYGISSFLCATRQEGVLKNELSQEVSYFYARRTGKFGLKGVFRLMGFIKREKITLLHAHSSSYMVGVLCKLVRPRLKLVWHDHYGNAENLTSSSRPLLRRLSINFDVVIVVNHKLKQWASQYLRCKRVVQISNYSAIYSSTNSKIDLPGSNGKRIVQVANYRIQKNIEVSIRAFAAINEIYPDWSLLLVGKSIDDNYYDHLISTVDQLNLTGSVFFITGLSDVSTVLKNSDIGLLSSSSEGLPLSLLEYGAHSLPVVVTDVGDCRTVVDDCGLIVPANDIDSLSRSLSKLIGSHEMRLDFGSRFSSRVTALYSEANTIKSLLSTYRRL